MKKNLKPCVCKLWKTLRCDRVLFVERSGELPVLARLRAEGSEPKETKSQMGVKSVQADPKPGDLSMSRLKRKSNSVEDRIHIR